MKPLEIALSGAGMGLGESGGADLTDVQCKPVWNCHNESPSDKYILIKITEKKFFSFFLRQSCSWP
jgi:hypothetical protein